MSNDWLADYATAVLTARARIWQYFDAALFSDPSRDILLNLFARERRGLETSAHECGGAASLPAATTLRWIDVLLDNGLVAYAAKTDDVETSLMRLTPSARSLMAKYLVSLATEGGLRPTWSSIIIE